MIFWVLFVHTKSTRGVRWREAPGLKGSNGFPAAPQGRQQNDFPTVMSTGCSVSAQILDLTNLKILIYY